MKVLVHLCTVEVRRELTVFSLGLQLAVLGG